MLVLLFTLLVPFTHASYVCTVASVVGCYGDSAIKRILSHQTSSPSSSSLTLETCATQCAQDGYYLTSDLIGVEFGTQCFCGHSFATTPTSHNISECQVLQCPGSKTLPGEKKEWCGAANRELVYHSTCVKTPDVPNFMPCTKTSKGFALPFCNHSLSTKERVADMIGRMTLAQKCSQTDDKMGAMPEIGWSGYNWNTECLHGLGAICLTKNGVTRCPSVFAVPPLLGSTFNRTVARQLGEVISDEIRAFGNSNGHRDYQSRGIGVSAWGPNLNIYRDARWGRNVEIPSEDPYHAGQYGVAYTQGLQWGNDTNYTKAIGALKHYTIYSVENGRGSTYFDISTYDIEDTYLPGFKAPVTDAESLGYMCSYAALTNSELIPNSGEASRPHSEPLCASKFFAQDKMRDEFGFHGYVQSDCGAVNNEKNGEKWATNATDAAARALADGLMNSNCGGGLVNNICAAIEEGLTTEAELEKRIERSLTLLMNAGLFDPLADQTYTNIPFETINSDEAQRKNLEAARQGLVLLKHPKNVLPLSVGYQQGEILLLGPHARTREALAGNYFEDIGLGICVGVNCIPTMEESLNVANGVSNVTTVYEGCNGTKCDVVDLQAIKQHVQNNMVKVVVMAMGIDSTIEGEGHDRMDIRLPGQQMALIQTAIRAAAPGIKLILLLFNGGMVTIESLKLETRLSVVECWYPGATGGKSIAEALFGVNRFGKLPFTYYAYNYTTMSDFTNMNMSNIVPGRSYKYLKDQTLALWPAFYGLSYTTFHLSAATLTSSSIKLAAPFWSSDPLTHWSIPTLVERRELAKTLHTEAVLTTSVTVTNTGNVEGDEVVFLFKNATTAALSFDASATVARKELIGYERVTLAPGASTVVTFNVTAESLSTVDAHGTRHVVPGAYELMFSRGHGEVIVESLEVRMLHHGMKRVVLSTMLAAEER